MYTCEIYIYLYTIYVLYERRDWRFSDPPLEYNTLLLLLLLSLGENNTQSYIPKRLYSEL